MFHPLCALVIRIGSTAMDQGTTSLVTTCSDTDYKTAVVKGVSTSVIVLVFEVMVRNHQYGNMANAESVSILYNHLLSLGFGGMFGEYAPQFTDAFKKS